MRLWHRACAKHGEGIEGPTQLVRNTGGGMDDTTRPRKSRRSGSGKRKKTIPVTSRYDEAEFATLDEAASRAGLTRASYQRVQSLDEPKTRSTRRPPIEREALAQLLGQLGKIGSNLNQLAKAANMDAFQKHETHAAVMQLRALMPHILQAMGRKP
jgi:hypothetical protein